LCPYNFCRPRKAFQLFLETGTTNGRENQLHAAERLFAEHVFTFSGFSEFDSFVEATILNRVMLPG
jgi:hypothetical protein